ncbi:hypothetical protein [Ruminococcus sp. 2227st1_E6_2227SCRN_220401]|uniref:hypothetical protein n=1 Tax=unclassified Ruminococcus TaxID=2608920 RepID=UPI00319E6AE3
MATKTQMVDFIYSNFSFIGGIKVKKRDLLGKSKEGLTEMIQKNGWEADFKKYLSTALVKFFVDSIESGKEYAWDCTADSEESIRKSLEKDGVKIVKMVPAKGHHRCRYCSSIAEGSDSNLLCDDCRELFGHSFYSDL